MRVSLDGGATWGEAPEGVVVDFDMQTDDSSQGSMTVKFTEEGLIADLWAGDEQGTCLETRSMEYVDMPEFFFGKGGQA